MQEHEYTTEIAWSGNRGSGTSSYNDYVRSWNMQADSKPVIACSNDPLLGGDAGLYNPEDLLLSSLAACHMLWYLHLASTAKIVVHDYVDNPVAVGELAPNGAARFTRATLRPQISLAHGTDTAAADAIHAQIHELLLYRAFGQFSDKL